MPRFLYTARGVDGRQIKGSVIAATQEEVTQSLQQMSLYVVSVIPAPDGKKWFSQGTSAVPPAEFLNFLQTWAIFLEVGIPMQSALLQVRIRTRIPSLAGAIERMQVAIDQGATVTEALKRTRLLPLSWLPVLEIGEKSGDFIEPLRLLHRYQSDFLRFKRQLFSEMIMPAILLVVTTVWAWLLFHHVVPALVELIEFSGGSTQVFHRMIAVLHGIVGILQWVVPVALAGIPLLFMWLNRVVEEMGVSRFSTTALPVVGPLIAQMRLILIVSGLRAQLEAGIPVVEAMEALGHSVPNAALRRDILQVHQKLWEGVPVPEAFAGFELLPPEGKALVVAGDASGKMPEMLAFVIRDTQAVLLEHVKRLGIFIRTAIIIGSAAMVGFIVILFFGLLFTTFGTAAESLSKR